MDELILIVNWFFFGGENRRKPVTAPMLARIRRAVRLFI